MKEEYKKILARGLANKDANKKFLGIVSKRKLAKLDRIVQKIHEEVFAEIDCTQCGHCCRTLGPRFTTTDIGRIAALLKMREAVFAKEYLRLDEDGDKVLKAMPCPFIQDDDQCSVYEKRPRACAQYPHTNEKNIRLHHLAKNTLYCPAAVLIVEKMKEQLG